MNTLRLVITSDTSSILGRLDYNSLPQQTLMELFIHGISNKAKICRDAETPKDLTEWFGVILDTDGDVVELSVPDAELYGSIALQWLPPTMQTVELRYNLLSGSLDLGSLPDSLTKLMVYGNIFTGTVCLTKLPSQMKVLNIGVNSLSGTLDFTKLPKKMEKLYVYENNFEGWADFSQLPESLVLLNVEKTNLEGEVVRRPLRRIEAKKSNVKVY